MAESNDEAAARSAGDAALMACLNAEVAALNQAIAVETADRMAADANLNAAITAKRAGADVLLARDGNGERVDCGPGRDRAFVDNGSIGAPDVVRHCERVQRG